MSYIIASTKSQHKEKLRKPKSSTYQCSQAANDMAPTYKWGISTLENKIQDEDNEIFLGGDMAIVK